jgi:hypothetical protein
MADIAIGPVAIQLAQGQDFGKRCAAPTWLSRG